MDLSQTLNSELDKIELRLFDNETNHTQLQSENARDVKLQQVVRSFNRPPRLHNLSTILSEYEFSRSTEDDLDTEWFVLARSATVIVSNILDELFSRTLPLGQDIMYWEHLLSSRLGRLLYMVQTAPSRVWSLVHALGCKIRLQVQKESLTMGTIRRSIFDRNLVRRMAFPHLQGKNLESATKMLSVETMVRQEIRKKIEILSGLRDAQAQSIGLLVARASIGSSGCLAHEVDYLAQLLETSMLHSSRQYTVQQNADFTEPAAKQPSCPQDVADKLILLSQNFKHRRSSFVQQLNRNTRPSVLTRYWPVVVGVYLGGSRALRYLTSRENRIKSWLYELSNTITSFWINWIVQPTTKILATIRHDEGSEVALLSSRSLSADLESLERMVVEFAQDNPQYASTADLQTLKESARNGDLTPVLVAYESNIKSPLRSAITGSLIRALLIQIQKTKVDVEVAINGIDKLLKSQELVFGFVGVSPALAFVWLTLRWLLTLGGRRGRESSSGLRLNNIKVLRNIDRLLYKSSQHDFLTYKRRGLVLCEAQLLKANAGCIASELRDQYLQDVSDLERAADLEGLHSILQRIFQVYAGSLSYP